MMNKIRRYWNQNRRKIIFGVIMIAFIILIIQILNEMAKRDIKNEVSKENIISDLPTQSIITGEKVDVKITEENVNSIDQFIKACNNKDTSLAYSFLSDECKEALYSTEEAFVQYYYNYVFDDIKTYKIENYRNANPYYTYDVKFYTDTISTGKVQDSNIYQDYITVNKQTNKLNINQLIYGKDIQKSSESDGVKITVLKQYIYKGYEEYQIEISNNTDKEIMIDSREENRSVYVVETDNASYSAFLNEIASNLYNIPSYFSRKYRIKFNKIYKANVTPKKIVFTQIVPDYEQFKNQQEVEKKRIRIEVEL